MQVINKVVIAFLLVTNVQRSKQQSFEGDLCIHNESGQKGTCINIIKCPSALLELKQRKLPQTCSFSGTVPIVCCPEQNEAPTLKVPSVNAKSGKCIEYAKYVNSTYIPPTLVSGSTVTKIRNNCGFKVVKLIVGGTKAKGKEFPHMAAIGYDSADGNGRVYHCGGSLISENYVLTAAHCFFSRENGAPKYVRVGDLNLKDDNEDADPQEYNIAQLIRHPEYKAPMQYNDIGLIRLEKNVEFGPHVRPICLTRAKDAGTQSAIAIGWGKQGSFASGSDHLLKVTLDFFSFDECRQSFEPNNRKLKDGIVDASQVCAGSRTDLKDTCPGDSGGPLQIYNTDPDIYCMYNLIGVTSFGKLCGASHSPAVYTRVSYFIDWIEKIVWP